MLAPKCQSAIEMGMARPYAAQLLAVFIWGSFFIPLIYIGFIRSIVGNLANVYSLRYLTVHVATLFQNLIPVIAAVFAALFLLELPTRVHYIAGILIMCGVLITTNGRRTIQWLKNRS